MKHLLTLVLILSLVATGALAAKLPPKEAGRGDGTPYVESKLDYTEGFEVSVPPAGWTAGVLLPTHTWEQDLLLPYSGAASAYIRWQDVNDQDETLSFTNQVDTGDYLTFFTAGSPTWTSNANFTVEINGTEVYNYDLENNGGLFTYEEVAIDLAAYVGTSPTFTFRYAGIDGADHYFDAVTIGAYEPPPPPEDISFCDMVSQEIGVNGDIFTGNTCDGPNLVFDLPCDVFNENGLEHYYEVEIPDGCFFTATVTNSADGALWVLGECAAPGGAWTCLGYADDTLSGDPEVVTYTNTSGSDQIVYLVVDSWGTGTCGDYELLFETDCAVATEATNFGSVKALFR